MSTLKYLRDNWDSNYAESLSESEKLKYRSNLLGADLRITNFGGGNTSAKVIEKDPVTNEEVEILWVKGSGGDLGSIELNGFSKLYMSKFLSLEQRYRGAEFEDEMVALYPLCQFGLNNRAPSIDTPLHGLVPFKNVDHLHSDWATALAAASNGQYWLDVFNERFNKKLVWIPWQRPGYHLGKMIQDAVDKDPSVQGAIMASHGIISWADDSYECYKNSIEIIDALGQFVLERVEAMGDKLFGGAKYSDIKNKETTAKSIMPFLRGKISEDKMLIGNYSNTEEALRFMNSVEGEKLAFQGTSCPDHFLRTKIRPLYVAVDAAKLSLDELKEKISISLEKYKEDYKSYYDENKEPKSPLMRNPNPTVILIPGVGMFSFGKNKKEARITGEFFINAIHVMEGATALANDVIDNNVDPSLVVNNYLALTKKEAFRIEYWELEEAKLRRQPAEMEMARKVVIIVGGGNGIGKQLALKVAAEGAHVVVADLDKDAAEKTAQEIRKMCGAEIAASVKIDICDRLSVHEAFEKVSITYGGLDILVNTAAMIIPPNKGNSYLDESWDKILKVNVTSNYILTEEFAEIINNQNSEGVVVLTSSANAVVPKSGSEPYDVSKAAVSHLIRELAIRFAPNIRVNGVSPASVIEGSTMFPRDRVMANLSKYNIEFSDDDSTEKLVYKLSQFYAARTLTNKAVRPLDVAEVLYFLASEKADRVSGHIIPVDAGLKEAFLR